MAVDVEELRRWVGRRQVVDDVIAAEPIARLKATLDGAGPPPKPGDALPPLWHWLYFLDAAPADELGADGHRRHGAFLPPLPLPRRMWAGSRLSFPRPLRVGERARRQSRLQNIAVKQGRSGELVFVTVHHTITGPDGPAIEEDQELVFRDAPKPDEAPARPTQAPEGPWRRQIEPDPVMLFRYSALTFNGHRIHYDRTYATEVAGYPGLVVHGPLIATLMLELVRHEAPGAVIKRFAFRARRPIFDTGPFTVGGAPGEDGGKCHVWAIDNAGWLAADGEVELAGRGRSRGS
ncbi:MAG: MaoC family dehydratase N-terminal domain-containing protein [Kiloniellales bacterium]